MSHFFEKRAKNKPRDLEVLPLASLQMYPFSFAGDLQRKARCNLEGIKKSHSHCQMKGLGPRGRQTANTQLANWESVPAQRKTSSHGAFSEGAHQPAQCGILGAAAQGRRGEGERCAGRVNKGNDLCLET